MRIFTSLAIVAAFCGPAAADQILGSQISYGNWNGGAYTFDDGSFSHCVVAASFMHGNTLMFSVNSDVSVSVGVVSPVDSFIANESFPVALFVDRRTPFYGNATAIDSRFAILNIDDFDRALDSFRRGFLLVVQSKYGETAFDLTGTSKALAAVYECAVANQSYRPRPIEPASSMIDPSVLMQVAAGNITALGVKDFSFLSASEISDLFPNVPANRQQVFWRSQSLGLLSGVTVSERVGSADLKSGDAADLSTLASMCDGDFVTGVRKLPEIQVDMREIRAACNEGTSSSEHYLTKFFLGDKIVYSWLWFEGEQVRNDNAPARKEMSESAALQTVSFLLK